MTSLVAGAVSLALKVWSWLSARRAREMGKLEAEVERLRIENDRLRRWISVRRSIDRLDDNDVRERLRRYVAKDQS